MLHAASASLGMPLFAANIRGFRCRVLGLRQAAGLYRVVFGGKQGRGIFDPTPLARIVGRSIYWRRLRSNIRQGIVRALTVSTTNVPTGRPVLFVDCPSEIMIPPVLRTHSIVR